MLLLVVQREKEKAILVLLQKRCKFLAAGDAIRCG